jgi:FlaG/FlaF family flagellin (archaellin)
MKNSVRHVLMMVAITVALAAGVGVASLARAGSPPVQGK